MCCDALIVHKTAKNGLKQPLAAAICDNFPTVYMDGKSFFCNVVTPDMSKNYVFIGGLGISWHTF